MARGILVLVLLVLLVHETWSAKDDEHCTPSCGNINIRYPFTLEGDPKTCGASRYNLSCENNQTVLHLYAGKYNVREINYSNFTIRVSDSGIQENDNHSIPDYFLSYENLDPYYITKTELAVFVNCEKPAISSFYVNISACFINSSKRYRYILVGRTSLKYVKDTCQVDQISLMSTWFYAEEDNNISCSDVHNRLIYGFELSWPYQVYCGNCTGGDDSCDLDYANNVRCYNYTAHNGGSTKLLAVGVILGSFLLALAVFAVYYIYRYDKVKKANQANIEKFLEDYRNFKPTRYSYADIKRITSHFADKLGEGAYGTVFKGKLSDEIYVAVKILNMPKKNGEEFINEVGTMGRIHHINVTCLVGFCADGFKRALVYEFLPNGSLDKFISSTHTKNSFLGWDKLQEIALGVANGIEYLHQGCDQQIVHFDIKPHNILLDQNFNPKISDFGHAKLCSKDQSVVSMTAARGTMGYIAPEVFSRNFGNVSYKADVYSFGMLLLEIIGGRKNVDVEENTSEVYFPEWIYNLMEQKEDLQVFIESDRDAIIAKKLAIVGLWCIQWHPGDRPSMKGAIQMLEEIDNLTMPPNPFASTSS